MFSRNRYGISYDQWLVLDQVRRQEGICQSAIAKATVKKPAYISRLIEKMQLQGLVLKVNNEKNKRANKIYLTPKGHDLSERIETVYQKFIHKYFNVIYERELSLVTEILNRVNKNYQMK
jgi:DNA-binding MarR family transcriptional regulator